MLRFGILLTVLGFGSLLMELTDRQFALLMWAEDYQPYVGIIVGVIGAALLVGNFVSGRSKTVQPTPAPAPTEAEQA